MAGLVWAWVACSNFACVDPHPALPRRRHHEPPLRMSPIRRGCRQASAVTSAPVSTWADATDPPIRPPRRPDSGMDRLPPTPRQGSDLAPRPPGNTAAQPPPRDVVSSFCTRSSAASGRGPPVLVSPGPPSRPRAIITEAQTRPPTQSETHASKPESLSNRRLQGAHSTSPGLPPPSPVPAWQPRPPAARRDAP